MPISGISKFLYDFWCQNRVLDIYFQFISELFPLDISTKKYDTNKWC